MAPLSLVQALPVADNRDYNELMFSMNFGQVQTDAQIETDRENDAYEPTMQYAQVG